MCAFFFFCAMSSVMSPSWQACLLQNSVPLSPCELAPGTPHTLLESARIDSNHSSRSLHQGTVLTRPKKSILDLIPRQKSSVTCRIPLYHCLVLQLASSGTMYRRRDDCKSVLHTHPAHSEMQMASLCAFIFFQKALFVHGEAIFSGRQVKKNERNSGEPTPAKMRAQAHTTGPPLCTAVPLLRHHIETKRQFFF